MSFTASAQGTTFEAGFFLVDDEQCLRETASISASHLQKVTRNNRTIVPAGAIIPANGSSAKGILYEDIDVTDGSAPGSIVTKGKVYEDRLPASAVSDAKTALTGIIFVNEPAANRPAIFKRGTRSITATAADSATASSTDVTVDYTLDKGETFLYKAASGTAPAVTIGQTLANGTDGWTSWDGDDPIATTNNYKITIAAVNGLGQVVAFGSTTAVVA